MHTNNLKAYLLVIVFLSGLAFPLLNQQLHLVSDTESHENRAKAKMPAFNPHHPDSFPAQYESYYNDTFPLRNRLSWYYTLYKMHAFHRSPYPKDVLIGKNGWLFGAGKEQNCYLGTYRFTDSELQLFKKELEARQKFFAAQNCKFYLVISPIKAVVYPEYMADEEYRINDESPGQQLNSYLNANSSVKPIDIYNTMIKNKGSYDLYYPLDHHWTSYGAFLASNEIISRVQKDFKLVKPLSIHDFILQRSPGHRASLEYMLGDAGYQSDSDYDMIPKNGFKADTVGKIYYPMPEGFPYPWDFEFERETKNKALPKLLLICDSYGTAIFPFLAENFSRSVKIFDGWVYGPNEKIAEAEKPDVCILLIHETVLHDFMDYHIKPKQKTAPH